MGKSKENSINKKMECFTYSEEDLYREMEWNLVFYLKFKREFRKYRCNSSKELADKYKKRYIFYQTIHSNMTARNGSTLSVD